MGIKSRISLGLAAIGLAVLPSSAEAQQYVYYNVCGPARTNASLTVCASADLSLVGSRLQMRVWNMEVDGSDGLSSYASANGGWHTIISVGLEYTGTGQAGSGDLVSTHYIFAEGPDGFRQLTRWHSVTENGVANPLRVELGGLTEGHYEGIVGCTDPGPEKAGHVQTCNSYGFSPYVLFTFNNVDPNLDFSDYNFEFYGAQIGNYNDTAKPSGSGVTGPGNVVPEPISMVLLGSGLLGIGGVGFRRRRREEDLVA